MYIQLAYTKPTDILDTHVLPSLSFFSLHNLCHSIPLPFSHSLQMVTLYRDPEGLTVFRGEATAVATAKASSDQSTIETLRRRIRELETIVSQNVYK